MTVSNGSDLEVGVQLLCICLWMCIGVRYIGVCVCVFSHYDGDSRERTRMHSTLFRPDAPVTSWPCSLPSTFPRTHQEVVGDGKG